MNKLLSGDLYNQDLKERFLEQYPDKTRKFYRYVLAKAFETEYALKKDIYDFSDEESDKLLYKYNNGSIQSLQTVNCVLKQYVDYCVDKGYGFKKENYFDISRNYEDLQKYIKIEDQSYISRETLEDIVGKCVNAQDAVIFCLLYDSVKGENAEEIVNLKVDDCNFSTNTLKLTRNNGDTRTIQASDLTMSIIREAILEQNYIKNNGVDSPDMRAKTYKIIHTDYVVRISARDSGGKINPVNVIARINRMKMWYGNPHLTVTNIWLSGMLDRLKTIKEEKGELTKQDYLDVNRMFGYEDSYWFKTKIRLEQFLAV